jgi:hypothetical protein
MMVAGTQMHTVRVLASRRRTADQYPADTAQQISEFGRQTPSIGGRQAFFA